MIISHQHRFIFIKTRKTAGSTFEQLVSPFLGERDICTGSSRDGTPALNCKPDQNGHLAAQHVRDKLVTDEQWTSYFKFAIERNPWDKLVSSYYWHRTTKAKYYASMSFEEYVLRSPLIPHDWPLYTDVQGLIVDRIYKFEELGAFYEDLNQRLGLAISPDSVSSLKLKSGLREVADYRDLHTDKTREFVAGKFRNECDLLSYSY